MRATRALRRRLAGARRRRYSLPVGIIRWSALSACAALVVSCAPSQPPPQIPVATRVNVSRVISADVPPRPVDCPIETLSAIPSQPYRELGTIEVPDGNLGEHNTLLMLNQNACAMGADAIVVSTAASQSRGSVLEAVAIAYADKLAERAAQSRAAGTAPAAEDTETGEQLPAASPEPEADAEPATATPSAEASGSGAPITEQQIGPAEAPTPSPTAVATPAAAATPAPAPSPIASETPAPTPSPAPAATPSPIPSASPTPASISTAAPAAAATPAPKLSPVPTVVENPSPSPSPTEAPSPSPSPTPLPAASPARAATVPLSLFRIVPGDEADSAVTPQAPSIPVAVTATAPAPAPSPSASPAAAEHPPR